MLLPKFEYHEPNTLDEICRIMGTFRESARLIAGGTDLMVNMKQKAVSPDHVVAIGRIDELKSISMDGAHLKIGACITVADLLEDRRINEHFPALAAGARNLGTPLIRNLATIGGNLASARPAADLPPPLMAYDAKVSLRNADGNREISLDDFFFLPGVTQINPDEVLCFVKVSLPTSGSGAGYAGLGARKAQDCNIVNVASFIRLDEDEKTIVSARIVMSSVGPTPLRAFSAEKHLAGEGVSDRLFDMAAKAACTDARPIDDFRGSAAYKRDMIGVLVRRTLDTALKDARKKT